MLQEITQQQLAEAILGIVRDVGAAITGTAISDRLAGEPILIPTTTRALLSTLDAMVEARYLERELLPGQRSTYRVHADCPAGPVKILAAAPAFTPAVESAAAPRARKPESEMPAPTTSAAERSLAQLILEALSSGKPMTPAELSKATGRKVSNVYEALNRLRKAGRIHKPHKLKTEWVIGADPAAKAPQAAATTEDQGDPPAETQAAPGTTAKAPIDYYEALALARRNELRRDIPQGPSPEISEILQEVARATVKFPTWPTDPLHAVAVLGEEFGELTKATLQLTYEPHKATVDDVRAEAVQTAAMALRFLTSLS